jgi:hypothetical protein
MRLRVERTVERPPGVVFDFIARDHWRNHPRWDPNVIDIIPVEPGPIRAGSRAHVRRKRGSGDGPLEVLEFEPDSRWVSRNQIGPFSLTIHALIRPDNEAGSRLTLISDTRARGAVRFLLPLLAPVFRRQMQASVKRIEEMVETETPRG